MQIFIVGMYKSGTTWLLSVLAQHPETIAYREFDVVRAFFDRDGAGFRDRTSDDMIRAMLTRYPILRLPGKAADAVLAGDESPLEEALAKHRSKGRDPRRTLLDLGADGLGELVALLRAPGAAAGKASRLLEMLSAADGAPRPLVLKAADQLPVMGQLDGIAPGHRKIVIVRDGRDAAVSAYYFRQLMIEQGAPWAKNSQPQSMLQLFQGWASRIRMVQRAMAADDLYVLRYEDLQADFAGQVGPLLDWCGLASDAELVASLADATSFRAQAGRDAGEEKAAVLRKGVVGDWRSKLSESDARELWEEGGELLEAFGYGRDGEIMARP